MRPVPTSAQRILWRRAAATSGQLVLAMLAGQGILSFRGGGMPFGDFVVITAGMVVIRVAADVTAVRRRAANAAS